MKKLIIPCLLCLTVISCSRQKKSDTKNTLKMKEPQQNEMMAKKLNKEIPTIGVLLFEGVIFNEVIASFDVFSTYSADQKQLFNVITVAPEHKTFKTAHGLKITPDYTIENTPDLSVLVIPSSYNMTEQTSNKELVKFIQEQNKTTDYIASHCAGAFLIGETGVADNKEIVTYVTGGEFLKSSYPKLKVADDSKLAVVQDGKFFSSNGNLVSYVSSFDLLEEMTSKEHREYVEASLLFDRLKN